MHNQENTNLIAQWVSEYGPTFVYRGFLGGRRLITTDPLAIAHILRNPYQYPKPEFIRDNLASMAMGHNGLLTVEGDDHQRQVLLPFFLFCITQIVNCLTASNIGKPPFPSIAQFAQPAVDTCFLGFSYQISYPHILGKSITGVFRFPSKICHSLVS